ncbi:hypothetical protein [Ornithinibacillus scapharcae]|uniref:hypothetical protein n=1 Tax=Ornithinibacillus scapharcae TaxID=1147159 RepID=UPI000225AB1B|nr:hypothetical protein [Ornithinibacillus scapharcae]
MLHCPHCGSFINEEEQFCVTCGKKLPTDIHLRSNSNSKATKLWFLPIGIFVILLLTITLFNSFLDRQSTQAKKYYQLGEESIEVGNYKKAKQYFQSAVEAKPNFSQGEIALEFVQKTTSVKELQDHANKALQDKDFQSALSFINDAEDLLKNFNGIATSKIVEELEHHRNTIKIEQLKSLLSADATIDELKVLIWEADSIKDEEAAQIAENIRNQIIDYTYTKASEQLSEKQFSDAQYIVDDGLKYAPYSDKLQSLKTTIEKEKVTFETTQEQRIQQAINTANEEREMNETDAIKVVDVKLEKNSQGNLVVKGEVKSIATIPISSIQVEYALVRNNTEFLTNGVYVYPDTLYPNENGKFEFTHFDMNVDIKQTTANVKKITWYTE